MTVINRQPSGLSNFLQVQAGGRNPDDISQTVRATIDIEPYYMPDRLRAAIEPFSMTPGQLEFVEVPEGEVWKVLSIAMEITATATSALYQFSVWQERIPGQGLNGVPWVSLPEYQPVQANVNRKVLAMELAVPRVLTSSQRVVLSNDSSDAPNPVVGNFYVTYVLLQG